MLCVTVAPLGKFLLCKVSALFKKNELQVHSMHSFWNQAAVFHYFTSKNTRWYYFPETCPSTPVVCESQPAVAGPMPGRPSASESGASRHPVPGRLKEAWCTLCMALLLSAGFAAWSYELNAGSRTEDGERSAHLGI